MKDLERLHQVISGADVRDVYGGAEGIEHLHLLQDVFTARGADDEQLTALRADILTLHTPLYTHIGTLNIKEQCDYTHGPVLSSVKPAVLGGPG